MSMFRGSAASKNGGMTVVISHGLVKEDKVPVVEIDKAVERKRKFEDNPAPHICVWERK